MSRFVIVSGSLRDGFRVFGPYEDAEAASAACEGVEAVVMPLSTPDEAETEL